MRITREADYAVRCVLHLAEHRGGVRLIDDVASAMQIPRSFAAKILQKLVRAGLVHSRRGVGGGFELVRDPREVSLRDAVAAVSGPLALNDCVVNPVACARVENCAARPAWCALTTWVDDFLGLVTFAALLERAPLPRVSVLPASGKRRPGAERRA